jgi:hypothetical protein
LHWAKILNDKKREKGEGAENLKVLSNLSHIPLGVSLGVGLLDHMADLCLVV